jgi:nucleotide-binding universal stress UspA family protein
MMGEPSPVQELLRERSLIYVTGKGGSGKSTVAAALGIAAARRGRRTAVCELTGAAHLASSFAGPDGAVRATPEGREALRTGARLAEAARASLRVIMVLDPSLAERTSPGMLAATHHEHDVAEDRAGRSRIAAERALDDAIADIAATVPVERDVLFQDPADGLAAASEHLDLLIMGSRAYGPMRAVMLGGVSRRVITRAACPVLVLPRGTASAADELVPSIEGRRVPA